MSDANTRMSIDIPRQEHKKLKMRAAKEGVSIRKFVLGCINNNEHKEQPTNKKDSKS